MNYQQIFIAILTLSSKEISRILRIWTQTIVPPAITMTLYYVLFGKLLGSRFGEIEGFTYIEFIVPGLIMMGMITNSYSNVSSSFFSSKFRRSIEELLISPMPNWVILIGYMIGGMFRGLIVGLVVTVISLAFIRLHLHSIWVLLGMALLTSALFSIAGLINGLLARKFDDIAIVPTFVLTPLTYLGGVFYSVDFLPEFWKKISFLNPILYMVNAIRFGFLGHSDIDVSFAFTFVGFSVLILYLIAHRMLILGKGLRK